MPFALLGAWVFLQTGFLVTALVQRALQIGLGGEALARLIPSSSGLWTTLSAAGWTDGLQTSLALLGSGTSWLLSLSLFAVISVLYWSWMASWWVRRRRRLDHND
jgi:hypothetical protein